MLGKCIKSFLETLLNFNHIFLLPEIVNTYNHLFFNEDATAIVKYTFATPLGGKEPSLMKILVEAVNKLRGVVDQIFCVEYDESLSEGFQVELFEMDFKTHSGLEKRVLDRSLPYYINGYMSLVDDISRYI